MVLAQGEKVDFALSYPFRILIGGSLNSGKSTFVANLLKTKYAKNIVKVYFYGEENHTVYQSKIGLPKSLDFPRHSCIIIDNQYSKCINSKNVKKLFDKSEKQKWSIIVTSRDLSEAGQFSHYIMTNSNYIAVSTTTNRIFNRRLAEDLDFKLPFKVAFDDVKDKAFSFLMFNQSEDAKEYAAIISYINDRRIITYTSDGIQKILLTKDFLNRNFELIDLENHFNVVKNDEQCCDAD